MSDFLSQVVIGFVPGAFGGTCSVIVGHPFDTLKTRIQTASQVATATTNLSTSATLRNIIVKEGILSLYAGVTAPLLAVTPAFAISFFSYDLARTTQLRLTNRETLTTAQIGIAGGFSGLPLAFVLGPLERVKCLMQVNKGKYTGFNDCVRHVLKEGGIRSLFRGTGMTIMRDVPGNCAYFSGYELTRATLLELEGREKPSVPTLLASGATAGIANWIVAIPFDTIKSRWQTAPSGTYSSVVDVFQKTIATDGPKGLFRGLSASLMRAAPANAACILGVETIRGIIIGE